MEGDDIVEIQDGNATFAIRSITDMYKEIQQLKKELQVAQQSLIPVPLAINNDYIFGVKVGNIVIISFDGFPTGSQYPTGWGASIATLDIGYKAKKKTFSILGAQSVLTQFDDGNIVVHIEQGSSILSFDKYSGNGDVINFWARGQIVIPVEE